MTSSIPPKYVLGQSAYEYERLTLQAKVLRPFTEKFFKMAGIRPGMRVLEVGSGGRVLGVDRDALGLEHARERTRQQGFSSWVSFQASNLDELEVPDQFHAIAGRYILLYQHDPGTTIRHLLKFLKAGG